MKAKPLPSQELLLSLFDYSIITGKLYRRSTGTEAGWFQKTNGYRMVEVRKHGKFLVHRIIWKMVTGEDAPFIDHEDLHKTRNWWLNLRDCTKTENQGNRNARRDSKSGRKGIHWDGSRDRWIVAIQKGSVRSMRRTKTLAAAIAYHRLRSAEMYGEFARSS